MQVGVGMFSINDHIKSLIGQLTARMTRWCVVGDDTVLEINNIMRFSRKTKKKGNSPKPFVVLCVIILLQVATVLFMPKTTVPGRTWYSAASLFIDLGSNTHSWSTDGARRSMIDSVYKNHTTVVVDIYAGSRGITYLWPMPRRTRSIQHPQFQWHLSGCSVILQQNQKSTIEGTYL